MSPCSSSFCISDRSARHNSYKSTKIRSQKSRFRKGHNKTQSLLLQSQIQTERSTLPSHPIVCLVRVASKAFASSVEDSGCSQNDDHCQREDAHSYPQAHPRVRVQVAAGHSRWQHNHRTDTCVITQLTEARSVKTGKLRPIDVVDVPHSTKWLHLRCNKMAFTYNIHISPRIKIHNTNTKCG